MKEKATQVATSVTDFIRRIGEREARQVSQPTEPLTGAEPETPVPQQAEQQAADDVETMYIDIQRALEFGDRYPDQAQAVTDNLVGIGIAAYRKMRQYQEIVKMVEQYTGENIANREANLEIAEMGAEAVFETGFRFHAFYTLVSGQEGEETSRQFVGRGDQQYILQLIEIRKSEFIEEVLNRLPSGSSIGRVDTIIDYKKMVAERSLQSFEEPLSGGSYEL